MCENKRVLDLERPISNKGTIKLIIGCRFCLHYLFILINIIVLNIQATETRTRDSSPLIKEKKHGIVPRYTAKLRRQ